MGTRVFIAVLFALNAGCSQIHSSSASKDVMESPHSKTPAAIECQAAQTAINTSPYFFGFIDGVEITDYLGDSCLLNVTFTSTDNILRFIDARVGKLLDPTVTVVRSGGKLVDVKLMLQVNAEVQIPTPAGLPATAPAKRAATLEVMKGLDAQLIERVTQPGISTKKFDIAHTSIIGAQGGLGINVAFSNAKGLRDFVDNALTRDAIPSPMGGWFKGVLYYTPIVLEVLDDDHGLPSATVVTH